MGDVTVTVTLTEDERDYLCGALAYLSIRQPKGAGEDKAMIDKLRAAAKTRTVEDFIREVNERAEYNMALTNRVEGAHWNAMKQVAKDWGIVT